VLERREALDDADKHVLAQIVRSPIVWWLDCRREDSNLHSLNGNQILNLVSTYFKHIGAGLGPRWEFQDINQNAAIPHCTRIIAALAWHGQFCPPNAPQKQNQGDAVRYPVFQSIG
jgi:hypothetical protein